MVGNMCRLLKMEGFMNNRKAAKVSVAVSVCLALFSVTTSALASSAAGAVQPLSVPVPDGGATAVLLGFALLALGGTRRVLKRRD